MENQRMDYRLKVYQFETTDGIQWAADFVDLPGCGGGGNTRTEAVKAAEENLAFYLEMLEEEGLSIPEPTTEPEVIECSGKIALRILKSTHSQLKELSELEGTSVNQLLQVLIAEGVEHHKTQLGIKGAAELLAKDIEKTVNSEVAKNKYDNSSIFPNFMQEAKATFYTKTFKNVC